MPCNTIITNTVDLTSVKNHNLLHAALKAAYGEANVNRAGESTFRVNVGGYMVTIANGRATSPMAEAALQGVVSKVKQAYSRKAIEVAARRFGWTVTKDPTGGGLNRGYIQKGV